MYYGLALLRAQLTKCLRKKKKKGLQRRKATLPSFPPPIPSPAHLFLILLFVRHLSLAICCCCVDVFFFFTTLFFSSESCNCLVNIFVHLLQHLCIEEKKRTTDTMPADCNEEKNFLWFVVSFHTGIKNCHLNTWDTDFFFLRLYHNAIVNAVL